MSKGDIFKKVPMDRVPSSQFDLTHSLKMSFKMGQLTPSLVLECLPGDRFRIQPESMLRLAPMVAPVMQEVKVRQHFFFVPYRILWDNWEKWITGEYEGEHPYIDNDVIKDIDKDSTGCYLGYPVDTKIPSSIKCSAFPISAYCHIYNEYYRDQNLVPEIPWKCNDGVVALEDEITDPPLRAAWNHDYFTSCLPFAQKGDAVTLPLTNDEAVDVYLKPADVLNTYVGGPKFLNADLTDDNGALSSVTGTSGGIRTAGVSRNKFYDPVGSLAVDINEEAVLLNSLRVAIALQGYLEKNARGGTRYIEHLSVHWGQRSSDGRLQRPEYIGGVKSRMTISEVLSTAQTAVEEEVTPLGQLAGHGITALTGNTLYWNCEEHGVIIGIMNVQPAIGYYPQGVHRSLTRYTHLDYPIPSFANLGEQAVMVSELYAATNELSPPDETVFGYIPIYSEMKYMADRLAGEFVTTLEYWHMHRKFAETPALNAQFITCNPTSRIFAVTSESVDKIYSYNMYNVIVSRKLPKFGVPSIL